MLSKELESERSRSQESAKEAVEKAQDSIKVYVKEQKQVPQKDSAALIFFFASHSDWLLQNSEGPFTF